MMIFRIGSIIFRCFVLLSVGMILYQKAHSLTGFDYIPPGFYIALAIPVVTLIILTAYYTRGDKRPRSKQILKIISLVILVAGIAFQCYVAYELYYTPLYEMTAMVWIPFLLCVACTVLTVVDVIRHGRT